MDIADRFVGALLGHAVGNAMGGPLAFMSREQIQIKHGVVTEMIGGGWLGLRPGETTAEVAWMLCLAESLAERRGFERADVARRYVERLGAIGEGVDNITRAALGLIEEGNPVEEASRMALTQWPHLGHSEGKQKRRNGKRMIENRREHPLLCRQTRIRVLGRCRLRPAGPGRSSRGCW